MAEAKTKRTGASVAAFLNAIPDPKRRADCKKVAAMMKKATGAPARMWGPSIVGFGEYTLRYANGSTAEWPIAGFSPRKQNLVLYLSRDFAGAAALMKKLGKHKTGKVCLYLNSLDDVDQSVLEQLVAKSVKRMTGKK